MTTSTHAPTTRPASPRTIAITKTHEVQAPSAIVWELLADYALDPSWRTGVIAMQAVPGGLAAAGTRTTETLRLAGRTWRSDGLVTDVDPGRRLSWRTTSGADASGARRVAALGAARTSVTLELVVVPHGLERVAAPLLRRMLARNLARDLGRLAQLAERRASLQRLAPVGRAARVCAAAGGVGAT